MDERTVRRGPHFDDVRATCGAFLEGFAAYVLSLLPPTARAERDALRPQ